MFGYFIDLFLFGKHIIILMSSFLYCYSKREKSWIETQLFVTANQKV